MEKKEAMLVDVSTEREEMEGAGVVRVLFPRLMSYRSAGGREDPTPRPFFFRVVAGGGSGKHSFLVQYGPIGAGGLRSSSTVAKK